MNNHLKNRASAIKNIFLTVVIILVSQLLIMQIINPKKESHKVTIKQEAARGGIYDRNGKLMVSIQASYDLTVIQNEEIEFDTLRLCELTELTLEDVRIRLKNARNYSKYKEIDGTYETLDISTEELIDLTKVNKTHKAWLKAKGTDESGDIVSEFYFEWSCKFR